MCYTVESSTGWLEPTSRENTTTPTERIESQPATRTYARNRETNYKCEYFNWELSLYLPSLRPNLSTESNCDYLLLPTNNYHGNQTNASQGRRLSPIPPRLELLITRSQPFFFVRNRILNERIKERRGSLRGSSSSPINW